MVARTNFVTLAPMSPTGVLMGDDTHWSFRDNGGTHISRNSAVRSDETHW